MSSSKAPKRALPSWMSARDDENGNKPNNQSTYDDVEANDTHKKARGQGKTLKDCDEEPGSRKKSSSAASSISDFSELLDGVVFVLSGFVNPERGILRSQALEMGAEYQPDWNSNCTLLVCAFPNTPKFRQVEADGGTIVSKDWIRECYAQKKLVDIETYLMHVGKPWRKSDVSRARNQDHETPSPGKSRKQDKQLQVECNSSSTLKESRVDSSKRLKEKFSPSKVKKWAIDDFDNTLAWLESQEEKPEPSEIKNVAAEGVLTCLQDAIDLLDKKQDLRQLTEQWNMVPHVVEELINIQDTGNSAPLPSKEDLYKQALTWKKIYEGELKTMSSTSVKKNEVPKPVSRDKGKGKLGTKSDRARNSTDYDSDETIEMTQEEIEHAYNGIASNIPKP